MYVQENFKAPLLQLYSNNTALEHLILEIEFNYASLVVTTMYRSPSSTNEYNDAVNNLISDICNKHVGNNLIIGDFNYHIDWSMHDLTMTTVVRSFMKLFKKTF